MLKKRDIKKIEKISSGLFRRIDSSIEVKVEKMDDENVEVSVKMDNPRALIGENGQTLRMTERLLKLVLRNNIDKRVYVRLDINDYRRKRREYLQEKAGEVADEVSLTGVEKKMPALPAVERRIIHMELESRSDVKTESEGKEPNRQVLVKPQN